MVILISIFVGAGFGASLRFALSQYFNQNPSFPLGTFFANALGGLLIGLLIGWMQTRPHLSEALKLGLGTGFLGGLTTFSTFSAEVVLLMHRGSWSSAIVLAMSHLICSLGLTALGLWLAKISFS